VLIEARIVIATESFARELGAKFGIAGKQENVLYNGSVDANTATANSYSAAARANAATPPPIPPAVPTLTKALNVNLPAVNAAGALALSIINAGYVLDMELSALQQEGRGEVISNPRIVTSNQKEAVIRQGPGSRLRDDLAAAGRRRRRHPERPVQGRAARAQGHPDHHQRWPRVPQHGREEGRNRRLRVLGHRRRPADSTSARSTPRC
jgi:hypothetical protein